MRDFDCIGGFLQIICAQSDDGVVVCSVLTLAYIFVLNAGTLHFEV